MKLNFKKTLRGQGRKLVAKVKRTLKLIALQVAIRPRLKLAVALILILTVLYQLSSMVVSYLKPREAEIKINGRPILVAEAKVEAKAVDLEQKAQVSGKLSPFEFALPVRGGMLTQGYRVYHRANDIAAPFGSPIRALGPGTVEFAGRVNDGKGNIVIVNHGDNLKSLYAHMAAIKVGAGNAVNAETTLGTVGLTGRTTGPHVHLEIYDHDIAVDPAAVLPKN